MFVARADVLLGELAVHRPVLHAGLLEIAAAWDGPDRERGRSGSVWPSWRRWPSTTPWPSRPPTPAGWPSCRPPSAGTTSATSPRWPRCWRGDGARSACSATATHVLAQDSDGRRGPGAGRLVAVLGLDDVVVVDTPDAVLVTTRERAQDVKAVVDGAARTGPLRPAPDELCLAPV